MKMTKKDDVPKWHVPLALTKALKNKKKLNPDMSDNEVNKFSDILEKLRTIDRLQLSECHYIEFLKLGLYLEQHQQITDLKEFSLCYTRIYPVPDISVRNKFVIQIPLINEDNPILNVSDSLKVRECVGERKYFLKVSRIYRTHVIAIANRTFCATYSPFKRYNVELVLNDYIYRSAHNLLSLVNIKNISPYIFPRNNNEQIRVNYAEINNNERSWFNKAISENPEQKQAVLNICAKSSFPAPYVLYGPPGTGKTATIVEAICQIWKESDEHILICAPSNAACDVIARRILQYIEPNDVYRIYSQGRDYCTIPAEIKNSCNYNSDGFADKLMNFGIISKRIIIVTLSSSIKLMELPLKFSHIFIDEAGQATQHDTLIPIQLMNTTESSKCQIVISGDPKQLGPCIRCKLAEPILGESILERLMRHEPYEKATKNGYDPNYITKLIRNYRSSLDIIHVSNQLFYDDELIACSTKKFNKFPITFHAVKGKEEKVGSSTSSYNQMEIDRVLQYVDEFINNKIEGKQFTAKDIGIVTPFSLQSLKLRKELEKKGLSGVDVGTVEIFQGQEKEIIIVSTVRSEKFNLANGEHIGFLSNPRRFNVALTRPKTFLVVVGNPDALQVDHCWKSLLKFCKEKDACRGPDFTLNEDVDQLFQRLNLGSRSKWSDHLFDQPLQLFEKDQDKKKVEPYFTVIY